MSVMHRRKVNYFFLAKYGAMLVLWLLLSWVAADSILKSHNSEIIKAETVALDQQVKNSAESIDIGLDYLHGIAALVAKDEKITSALSRHATKVSPSLPEAQLRKIWSRDSLLRSVDDYLDLVSHSLRADVVWVTNASGDCIASSNSRRPESFVGTNYADREYFQTARKGKSGKQYAMGRKTNIPGLYFSAPIIQSGRFMGVAVTKIDLPNLSHWVGQTDSIIADEHGVIILARDRALEMRSLPDADIGKISEAERIARYKRTDFPGLRIDAWDEKRFSSLHHVDQSPFPYLISSKSIEDEALSVHAFKQLPEVAEFKQERLKLFWLIGTVGVLLIAIFLIREFLERIHKHSELRAAKSASLLRAAIDSTVDGILVVDNERHVTAYNRRFADIWHIPPEVVAAGDDDVVLKYAVDQVTDRQAFLDKVLELYAHPELDSFDTFCLIHGTEIERYSIPQRLHDRIIGRVWSFRDVTEQRRAERSLRDSHDELEKKVRERTADLQSANTALLTEKIRQEELINQLAEAHSQLLQSEKMASIGQLAAGVAHEINNPVGYVNSNLTTLQDYVADLLKVLTAYEQNEHELTEATRMQLNKLKKQIDVAFMRDDIGKLMSESIGGLQRVKRIVLDLKDFSHVGESAKLWANIEQGMDSTLNVVWNELKYKAEVVKEYAGIPEIECIPTQINQVFMNLLMNAVQAIKDHGRITIRSGQESENVWVEVEDTGSGIEPKNLHRIFDPFFTTKPVGKGTGLGLSLSYSIVQKHGGRIEVRSEVGKGTVFRVILPVQNFNANSGEQLERATTDVEPNAN